jgi:hypothetical protein
MQVKEIARFSELKSNRENGPVVTKKLVNSGTIVAAVTATPGSSTGDITKSMGYPMGSREYRYISARLYQMASAKKPKIKRKMLDGYYRFYPINYKLTSDPKPVVDTPLMSDSPTVIEHHPAGLEQKAMEYAWLNPDTRDILKAFVDWYKGVIDGN